MAENFKPSTAQEFVGENNELPTRDELLSMFTKKQKDLAEKLAETEAKPGFKLDANEMMAKRRSEKQLKTELDSVNEEWKRLGGDKIDEAQAAVDALDFKSDASDHVKAKYALRDAKEAFYSNFTDEFNQEDNHEVGELNDDEWAEYQAQKDEADQKRRADYMPNNMADFGQAWDDYEADDNSMKHILTDKEVTGAKKMVESDNPDDIKSAVKIYKELLKKARKSVEAEYYDEDDYKQAANALAIEIFGKTEDEVRQAMQAAENKKNAAEDQSEADAADTAGAATDADTDAAIKERFEAMEKDELEIPEEYEATFKKTLEKQEAENKPGRIKRLLGRIGLKRTGIKRPGLISRIKQDSEYRNWLRERKGQAKPSLDGKVEVESGSQTETTDMNEFFETEISELNRRKPSGADREHMSDLIVQAKVLYNTNQRDKAKYLYQAVREHLSKLDAKSNNLWGSDVFDDNFRADLNRLGKKFEDADDKDAKPVERSSRALRVVYEYQREEIEQKLEKAKRLYDMNEMDKAKEQYQQAHKHLVSLTSDEPLSLYEEKRIAYHEVFDDNFYRELNEFGAKLRKNSLGK